MKKLQKISHWRIMEVPETPSKSMAESHVATLIHFRRVSLETPVLHEVHTKGQWISAGSCAQLRPYFIEEGIVLPISVRQSGSRTTTAIVSAAIIAVVVGVFVLGILLRNR